MTGDYNTAVGDGALLSTTAGFNTANRRHGAVFVNASGQLGTTTSPRRFKQDIADMGAASEVLLALRPVSFRYKPELDAQGLPQFGLIAEEVTPSWWCATTRARSRPSATNR